MIVGIDLGKTDNFVTARREGAVERVPNALKKSPTQPVDELEQGLQR
ncbi:hypothetical protein [Pseudomonas atagonensis]|nr:hypothetical protein [Pseudomonas atagonensis]